VSVRTETRNNLQIKYGFDFNLEQRTATVSLQGKGAAWDVSNWDEANWADFTDLIRNVKPFGRGNAFSLTFDHVLTIVRIVDHLLSTSSFLSSYR